MSKQEPLLDKYFFCVGFLAFIYGSVAATKFYLWKNKHEKINFPLCEKMKNIHPVILFPFEGEMYVVKGTSIVIYRNHPRGKYIVEIISRQLFIDGEDLTVEYILENYPESVSEDFIFNLNLFK